MNIPDKKSLKKNAKWKVPKEKLSMKLPDEKWPIKSGHWNLPKKWLMKVADLKCPIKGVLRNGLEEKS